MGSQTKSITTENTVLIQETKPKTKTNNKLKTSKMKRIILRHVWLVRIALLSLMLLFLYGGFVGFKYILNSSGANYYLSLGKDFWFTPSEKIKSLDGYTNIVILGKGGAGHEAPDLTDTIMFASVSHSPASIKLISLPRDIWVPELRAKLNSIYYWGNKKQEGGGLTLVGSVIEEIVGEPIHYTVVVDFSSFEKIIDTLDGIYVNVEHSFVDNKYPVKGKEDDECDGDPNYSCRYETITFNSGRQYMDSQTALKFVRSRHAQGDEGTDLARSARQQLVIEGIKEKIISKDILFSYTKLNELLNVGFGSLETDINPPVAAILARRLYDTKGSFQSHVLPQSFLVNPPYQNTYDNLYVFIPAQEDRKWTAVHNWITCIVHNKPDCNLLIPPSEE